MPNDVSLSDIKVNKTDPIIPTNKSISLSINQQLESSNDKPQQEVIHMAQPTSRPKVDISKLKHSSGNRKSADLSSLPTRSEVPDGMNVKKTTDIQTEIFEQGGAFDQMLHRRVEEFKEWEAEEAVKEQEQKIQDEIAREDADLDTVGESTQVYTPNTPVTTPNEVEYVTARVEDPGEYTEAVTTEEENKERETQIAQAKHLKMVDIRKGATKKEDNMDEIRSGSVQDFTNPEAVEDQEYIIGADLSSKDIDNFDDEAEAAEEAEDIIDEEEYDEEEEEEYDIPTPQPKDPVVKPVTPSVENIIDDTDEIIDEYDETENMEVENAQKIQPKPKKSIGSKIDRITRSYMAIQTEDEDDEDVEVSDVDDNDESINILKNMIAEKIKPVSVKTDITGFTIAKKGTMSNEILTMDQAAFAKWPLPATGIVVSMREISGSNLENLRSFLDRRVPDNRSALKIIYDHIVSPKPESFESWLNSIAYADFDNLFMLVYISAFADANFLPVDCTSENCGKPYLTDSLPIMDMVHFKNKETEQKFWDLYNEEPTNGKGLYTTEVIAISDNFAIGLKEPSLYSVLIEPNYFNAEFSEKYSQTIRYFPYIDSIYWIDIERKTLVPIKWKVYDNNIAKSVRSRIRRYDKIINSLTSDQHALILAYINAINARIDWFNYRLPETTCPHCGEVVAANDDYTALNLVFLRNRLAVLATT